MQVSTEQQQLAEAEEQLFARIAAALEGQRPPRSARQPARDRPRIGVFAGRGTLREGAWQVYGADQYTIEAIAEAGGYPQVLPTFPIVPGHELNLHLDAQTWFAMALRWLNKFFGDDAVQPGHCN
jgi:hypothetical protein